MSEQTSNPSPAPAPASTAASAAAPANPAGGANPAAAPAPNGQAAPPAEASDVALTRFFDSSPAARRAASSLKRGAEVGVTFTDVPGEWRFTLVNGLPRLLKARAEDPDFELNMSPGAVRDIAGKPDSDVGDLGILFFQHMIAKEPENKIKVKLHSGVLKLTMRGYLGVLAAGGAKVIGWMAQKGLRGPAAIASAISRLKKG